MSANVAHSHEFVSMCWQIRVAEGGDWPFSGAIVPGYPALHPMQEDFWEKYWELYMAERDSESPAPFLLPVQRM
jgi:hypothetical protein